MLFVPDCHTVENKGFPRVGMPLSGGLAEPDGGLRSILRYAFAIRKAKAEIELRHRQSLFGGLAIPVDGLRSILRHAFAILITPAEIALRYGMALFGGLAVPDGGLRIVLRHAFPFVETVRQMALGLGVALFGSLAEGGKREVREMRHGGSLREERTGFPRRTAAQVERRDMAGKGKRPVRLNTLPADFFCVWSG